MARFRIVPESSTVETEMTSSIHPIHARATQLRGVIEGELGQDGQPDFGLPHKARLELPVNGMSSGNRLQDMEMQRRMDTRAYPNIEVTVSKAWKVDGNGRSRARFDVRARGRSQTYEEDFTMRLDGGRLLIEGEHTFDMRDFGVSPPRFLTLKMDPQVKIRMRLEAQQEDGVGPTG